MAIVPLVPHDDLVVAHSVFNSEHPDWLKYSDGTPNEDLKESYRAELQNPDGTWAGHPLIFHKGSPEKGWHGWTTAKVIEALVKHMEYHQSTPFACEQNEEILEHLQAAHKATEKRRDERKERGVLYDSKAP
jgi:hypothetical protein